MQHIDPDHNADAENTLLIENDILVGYFFIAFFDDNKNGEGDNQKAISYFDFPLSYFEPFKPINI